MSLDRECIECVLNYIDVVMSLQKAGIEKNAAVRAHAFEKAAKWRDKENELRNQLPTHEKVRELLAKLKQDNATAIVSK